MKTLKDRYYDAVFDALKQVRKQIDLIRKAGAMLTSAKYNGGRLLVYDLNFALSLDCWTRGSGLYDIHIYRYSKREFQDGDSLILGSYRADDKDDISIVRELRAKSNTCLVTISPHILASKSPGGTLLHELSDVAIDNGLGDWSGTFDVKGISGRVLPIAREINFCINWAIQCEYIQGMIERGCPPTLFYLVHFPYFREYDAIFKKRVAKYGY